MKKVNETGVVIPALNVAGEIGFVLSQVINYFSPEKVIVVDDGSTDDTFQVASAYSVQVIRHEKNLGKGMALQKGFRFALSQNLHHIFTLDGDGQHDPKEIPHFLEVLERGEYDLVIGKRSFRIGEMPLDRILSNRLSSTIVSMLTRTWIPDSQCGYRVYQRKVLESLRPTSQRYEIEAEMVILALQKGFRIGWCPIKNRYGGSRSHIHRIGDTVRFLWMLFNIFNKKSGRSAAW